MAVGTTPLWSGSISSPQQLASVIQGEAGSDPASQFAVASVMYNRTQTTGFGGSDIQSVVTPSQFLGYNSTPNASAQSLANDLWSGNAPSGGSTGNATYFVSGSPTGPATSGIIGGGSNIGGNYYSDTWGSPSSSFQAPVYGGAQTQSLGTGATDPTAGSLSLIGGSATPGANASIAPAGASTAIGAAGASTAIGAAGASTAIGAAGVAGTWEIAGPAAVTTSATGIDKALSGAASTIASSQATTLAGATTTGTDWLNEIFSNAKDMFVRFGLVLFGLILLAGGVFWFTRQEA